MSGEPKDDPSSAPGPGDERAEQDRCAVCGESLGHRGELIRAWPGQFAHDGCASYSRRPRSRQTAGRSHFVHQNFTRR